MTEQDVVVVKDYSKEWKDYLSPPTVAPQTAKTSVTVVSPLSEAPLPQQVSEVDKDDLEQRSNHHETHQIQWIDLLQNIPEFYLFAVLCGLIYPSAVTEHTTNWWVFNSLPRQQLWVKTIHICTFLYTFLFIFNTSFLLVIINVPQAEKVLLAIEWICGSLPLIMMYPAVMILRRNLYTSTSLYQANISTLPIGTMEQRADFQVLKEAVLFGLKVGYPMLKVFLSLQVAYCVIQTAYTINNSTNIPTIWVALGLVFDVFIVLACSVASVFLLVGVTVFLVIEQRISYSNMLHLRTQAQQSTLLDHVYFATGLQMELRDKQSPMNVLFSTVAIDSFVCVILLFYVSSVSFLTNEKLIYNMLYMIVIFAKDIWIFMLLLWNVLKVNEMVDVLLTQISRGLIGHSPEFTNSLSLATVTKEIQRDEKRLRRLELYLLMKEYRIGSTILFYRPSKVQLIVQMTSVALGIVTSLLKIIVRSIS